MDQKTFNRSNSKNNKTQDNETEGNQSKTKPGDKQPRACRQTVLLSCSHVFHETCLEMFEELSMETNSSCPVCRSKYQKRVLQT